MHHKTLSIIGAFIVWLCPAKHLFIDSNGCDYGLCNAINHICRHKTAQEIATSNINSTCNTIDYAYKCLMGSDEFAVCKNAGYNGFGTIHIANGLYHLPSINTPKTINLYGSGATMTTLIYTEGDIFNNIHFYNNNIRFMLDNANIIFTNCTFKNGSMSLILQNTATATFTDCIFEENIIDSISLFHIESGSSLSLIRTRFINNIGSKLISIDQGSKSIKTSIKIIDSLFAGNNNMMLSSAQISTDSFSLILENNTFNDNHNGILDIIFIDNIKTLELSIENNQIFNYNHPKNALFRISSVSTNCLSNNQLTFENIQFHHNINTKLIEIHCISANMTDIELSHNVMTETHVFEFNHHSKFTVNHLNCTNNTGIIMKSQFLNHIIHQQHGQNIYYESLSNIRRLSQNTLFQPPKPAISQTSQLNKFNNNYNTDYMVEIAMILFIIFIIFNVIWSLYCCYGTMINRKQPKLYQNISVTAHLSDASNSNDPDILDADYNIIDL